MIRHFPVGSMPNRHQSKGLWYLDYPFLQTSRPVSPVISRSWIYVATEMCLPRQADGYEDIWNIMKQHGVRGQPGPLYTKRVDALSHDLVKSRSREIGCWLYRCEIWQASRQRGASGGGGGGGGHSHQLSYGGVPLYRVDFERPISLK